MRTPITIYSDTEVKLNKLAQKEKTSPGVLLEEMIRSEYYSRFGGERRILTSSRIFQENCPLNSFSSPTARIVLRKQTYEMFTDLLRVDGISSATMVAWLVELSLKTRDSGEYPEETMSVILYERSLSLLSALAEESDLMTKRFLEEIVRQEFFSRFSEEHASFSRRTKHREQTWRETTKTEIHVRKREVELLDSLSKIDDLPCWELIAWLTANTHQARHSRYAKTDRMFVSEKCERPGCFVE